VGLTIRLGGALKERPGGAKERISLGPPLKSRAIMTIANDVWPITSHAREQFLGTCVNVLRELEGKAVREPFFKERLALSLSRKIND
jgi:hypothetical protein